MFWVRYEYNKDLRSKKQQVSRPPLENEAPKVSRFQHVKISSSNCLISNLMTPRNIFLNIFISKIPSRLQKYQP
jgi:hypothetical protein